MDSSKSSGITGIPVKIIKACTEKITPILIDFFNNCLSNSNIPIEWTHAIVTPLYKKKGPVTLMNNYRGISILTLIAKLFEKLIFSQISNYLKKKMYSSKPNMVFAMASRVNLRFMNLFLIKINLLIKK